MSLSLNKTSAESDLEPADQPQPWQACLAICLKCANKVHAVEDGKTQLRAALKALVEERGLKAQLRPVDISCLDICPENRIAVAYFSGEQIKIKTVKAETSAAHILRAFGL